MKNIKVSIENCSSYDNKEVKKVLEKSLKNIGFKFKKNQKILLKPNILGAYHPEEAITTHPIIIEELVKILKKYNSIISIGDSSALNTEKSFKISGIYEIAKKYNLNLLNFSNEPSNEVNIDSSIKKIPLPKSIKDFDLIINLPKLKTHSFTNMTGAIKNLYGLIPGTKKAFYHMALSKLPDFSNMLVEIYRCVKPELNIMDGVVGIQGMGPGKAGTKIKSKIILASKNAVALDIVASEIIGFDKYEILTNKIAVEKNLLNGKIEKIGLKNFKIPFKKPSLTSANKISVILSNILPKPKISFDKTKCTKCKACGKNCPVKVISYNSYPKCNHKKCINCYCCIEICPQNAVYLKKHFIYRFLKTIYFKFKKTNFL